MNLTNWDKIHFMEITPLSSRLNELNLASCRYFDTIGSTNDEALRWVGEGAPDSALVLADEQTSGRGRMQRTWVTRPGVALAFSQIFIPSQSEKSFLQLYSPLAALAVADALEELYSLNPRIKWPNDVLLFEKKVCGILVEASWLGNEIQAIVVGVGINILQGSVPSHGELIFPATCVEEVLRRPIDRFDILRVVLQRMAYWRQNIGSSSFFQTWQEKLAFAGEMVFIQRPGMDVLVGKVLGVDPSGNLRLGQNDGDEILVSTGDVQTRRVK